MSLMRYIFYTDIRYVIKATNIIPCRSSRRDQIRAHKQLMFMMKINGSVLGMRGSEFSMDTYENQIVLFIFTYSTRLIF